MSSLLNPSRQALITSSLTMCNFLHHFSCYSAVCNLIFTAYAFSLTFPNFLSSFLQMEPTPSQVRNHYSQKNQEELFERALAFKKVANLCCSSNVYCPTIVHHTLLCRWPMSSISLVEEDANTDQEIGDDESENRGQSTILSDIEKDDLDHQLEFLLLGKARRDKSLRTTRVPLSTKWWCADTVIACSPLPNSRNPAGEMASPMLRHRKLAILIKLSMSDSVLSAQALPLHLSRGDQHVQQLKASADWNVP